jgi:uncharacterized protein (TIGR02996 family)
VTTGDALYVAILANPADDLPRLVYADWLEEHGDAERAKFIRIQIELARPDPPAQLWDEFFHRLQIRRDEYALLYHHRKADWSIPRLRGGQTFNRGFVDEVWAAAEDIVAHADLLLRFPLRGLRITAATEYVAGLAGLPILARITHLDLSNNTGIHNQFDRLFHNGGLRNLTSLTLRNGRVWGEDLAHWPMIPGFPNLTDLDLSGNPVGDNGLGILAERPGFVSLRSLSVRGDGQELYDLIGDEGLVNLARSPTAGRWVRLDFSGNGIGPPAVETLVATDRLTGLRQFNLSQNPIGPAAAGLARWPLLSTVEKIDLRDCGLIADTKAELLASPWAGKFILNDPPLPN